MTAWFAGFGISKLNAPADNHMPVTSLVHRKTRKPGADKLLPYFTGRERGKERVIKITPEYLRLSGSIGVGQLLCRTDTLRPLQIHDKNPGPGSRTTSHGVPQHSRITQMMQQAVADNDVIALEGWLRNLKYFLHKHDTPLHCLLCCQRLPCMRQHGL